ncbi:uncharacterized protein LOC114356900 [Ostrinia furnacalis]|uniref:uncharacterized protein LOC114356900 n=1 Tax=Ostrinia furnacalis TaxID=93504 RepID=UPI00103E3411|nr:uncharacterized protein LOC114356900 [Ostrinia furnacalis]
MPCGCCGNGFVFGHLMYILEKIAAFCAMSAIISCIVVTVLVSIGLGVGIGYNYCFVDMKHTRLDAVNKYQKTEGRPGAIALSGDEKTTETTLNTDTLITHPPSTTTTTTELSTTEMSMESSSNGLTPSTELTSNALNGSATRSGNKFLDDTDQKVLSNTVGSDLAELSDDQEIPSFPNIPSLNIIPELVSDIPHSPNFPGSLRRIPVIHSRVKPVESGQRQVGKTKRPKSKLFEDERNEDFDKIREGIKANAEDMDKDLRGMKHGKKTAFEKEHNDEAEYDEVYKEVKYSTTPKLKILYRKKHKKLTETTKWMPTIVVPLKKHANMSPLISKILAQNKNVTLQFITV